MSDMPLQSGYVLRLATRHRTKERPWKVHLPPGPCNGHANIEKCHLLGYSSSVACEISVVQGLKSPTPWFQHVLG